MATATPLPARSASWPSSAPDPQPRRRGQARTDLEDALVLRARTDPAAFGALYELHRRSVLAFVRSRIPTPCDAEDITQEVFLKALRAIGRFEIRRGSSFHAWLFEIAANAVADHHRRGRRRSTALDEVPGGLRTTGSSPDELAADVDATRRIWAAAASLPTHQRTALVLRVAADLPLDEISERMGRSREAVRLLLHRARHGLRRQLAAAETVQ
jgi:RNA polymerase sigma-70 factor (ECF subfamily)